MGAELDDGFSLPNKYQFMVKVVDPPNVMLSKKTIGFTVFRASVKISKITRDARAKLQFITPAD